MARGQLHDEHGVLWTENSIKHLPYNAVLRTRLASDDVNAVLEAIIARCRERDVAFMWVDHPTASPEDLGRRLRALGLEPVEVAEVLTAEDLAAHDARSPAAEAAGCRALWGLYP